MASGEEQTGDFIARADVDSPIRGRGFGSSIGVSVEAENLQVRIALLVVLRILAGHDADDAHVQADGVDVAPAEIIDIAPREVPRRIRGALLPGFDELEADFFVRIARLWNELDVANDRAGRGLIRDCEGVSLRDPAAFMDEIAFGQDRKFRRGEFVKRAFFHALVKAARPGFVGRSIVPRHVSHAGNGRVFEVVLRVKIIEEHAHALHIDAGIWRGQDADAEVFPVNFVQKKVRVLKILVIGDFLSRFLGLTRKGFAVGRGFVLRRDERKIDRADPAARFDAKQAAPVAAAKAD